MESQIPFFDGHVHADSRSYDDFTRLKAVGCAGLVALAGPCAGFSSADSVLDYWRRLDRLERSRISSSGMEVCLGIGIHPSGIPERNLDQVLDGWSDSCLSCHASAVGEIGLQNFGDSEEEVLRRGLEVARELGIPAVVHSPRENKAKAVSKSLELISRCSVDPELVVLDHLDDSVMEQALDSGCWLGLSVHPTKLTALDAAGLVAKYGPERFIFNSDLGANPSFLFALPAAMSAMSSVGLERETIRRVVYDNPKQVFGSVQMPSEMPSEQ